MKYLACLLLVLTFSCTSNTNSETNETGIDHQQLISSGYLRYEVIVKGPDSSAIKSYYLFNPSAVELWWNDSLLRLMEHGGFSHGNIWLNRNKGKVYQLDSISSIAYSGTFSDFEQASKDLQNLMPDHYRPVLESIHETKNILGLECSGYRVVRSGFTRPEAVTIIWIAENIQLPSFRFDIETSANRVTTPLPLYLGVQQGTIFQLDYEVDDMFVSYQLTSLDSLPPAAVKLEIPDFYQKE